MAPIFNLVMRIVSSLVGVAQVVWSNTRQKL
jgi:hypothetical protein